MTTSEPLNLLPIEPSIIMRAKRITGIDVARELPNIPYNFKPVSTEESIRITLHFMAASPASFKEGQPVVISRNNTLLWPVWKDETRRPKIIPNEARAFMTDETNEPNLARGPGDVGYFIDAQDRWGIEYFFDAHGRLVQQQFSTRDSVPLRTYQHIRVRPGTLLINGGHRHVMRSLELRRQKIVYALMGVPHLPLSLD
jgi:hypothetical protein